MSIFDSLKKKTTTTTTKATTSVDEAKKKIEALKKTQATKTVSDAKAKIDAMKKAQAGKTTAAVKTPEAAAGKFAPGMPVVKYIAKHKLTADQTLSHVALKYYGSAAKKYWMLIYNHNKAVIGDNPGIVRPGMELNIPELPSDFKA